MADKTEYKVELVQSEEIRKPDELIAGTEHQADGIKISEAGEYKRGMLLMSGSDGFVKATAEGVKTAEVCILCDDAEVPEESYIETAGYFTGIFKGSEVILPYEGEEDDHAALLEGIRAELRKQNIYLV